MISSNVLVFSSLNISTSFSLVYQDQNLDLIYEEGSFDNYESAEILESPYYINKYLYTDRGYAEGSTNDNESQVYGVYNGVTVGVITDANGGLTTTIGTIFPDSLQRSTGDF